MSATNGSTKRNADADPSGDESKVAAKKQRPAPASGSKQAFRDLYDELCAELLAELPTTYEMPQEAVDWIKEMMDYTVPGGKLNRGLTVVHSLQLILGRELTADELRKASVLGWCIEWLQACFLVADDVMDASKTRRGAPCWYLLKKVGMTAINDSFILRSCVSWLLQRTFGSEKCYLQLVEMFRVVTLQTELGQLLDLTSAPASGGVDLSRFTIERYNKIVKYKTAFYSFYLPVACGMVVAGIATKEALKEANDILVYMGTYFQIQDDVLDCFGAPEVIGKIGTDIQDNKCGWLVVQALDVATPAQRLLLEENYARDDDACVEKVKALYRELKLKEKFDALEAESFAKLTKMIAAAKHTPAPVFNALLNKIYKRQK